MAVQRANTFPNKLIFITHLGECVCLQYPSRRLSMAVLIFILYYLCFAIPNVKMYLDPFLIQLFLMFCNVLCKAVPHPCAVTRDTSQSCHRGLCPVQPKVNVEEARSPKPFESTENYLFHVAGQKQCPVSRIVINDPAVLVLSIFLSLSLSMCLNIIYIFWV